MELPAATVKDMVQTTVNQILLGEISEDHPKIDVGDLLFSDHQQRDVWAEALGGEEDSELRERLEALYRFGREVMQTGENRRPVSSPAAVISKLTRERFKYPGFHWVTWPLNAQRLHMFEVTPNGSRRYHRVVTKLVPRASELPAVEPGGGYLLLYMGPPEAALEKEGARRALGELCADATVFDVLFRKYSGSSKILYSTRAGEGYFKATDGSDATTAFEDDIDLTWFQVREPLKKGRR